MKHLRTVFLSPVFRTALSFSLLWLFFPAQPGMECERTGTIDFDSAERLVYTISFPLQQGETGTCETSVPADNTCDVKSVPPEHCLLQDTGLISSQKSNTAQPVYNSAFQSETISVSNRPDKLLGVLGERLQLSYFTTGRSLRAPPAV